MIFEFSSDEELQQALDDFAIEFPCLEQRHNFVFQYLGSGIARYDLDLDDVIFEIEVGKTKVSCQARCQIEGQTIGIYTARELAYCYNWWDYRATESWRDEQ